MAAAEARTQEYEQKLREARLAIFKAQEARRQQAQQLRAQALAEARAEAQEQIREARLPSSRIWPRRGLVCKAKSSGWRSDIIRTILKPAGAAPSIGGAQ